MLCIRCAHPLSPRADRCLRCFALNPQNRPGPIAPPSPPPRVERAQADEPVMAAPSLPIESEPEYTMGTPVPEARTKSERLSSEQPIELSEPEVAWAKAASAIDALPEAPQIAPPLERQADIPLVMERAKVAPVTLSIDSDPPPRGAGVGALSIHSDPLPKAAAAKPSRPPKPAQIHFDEISDPKIEGAKFDPHLAVTEPPDETPFAPLASEPPQVSVPQPLVIERAQAPEAALAPQAVKVEQPSLVPESALALDTTPPPPVMDKSPLPEPANPLGVGAISIREDASSEPPNQDAPASAISEPADPTRPSLSQRLLTWTIDAVLVLSSLALFVGLAVWVLGAQHLAPAGTQSLQSWADQLLFGSGLKLAWLSVGCALALAYSWLFSALGGRTPGMVLTGTRLTRDDGGPLSPLRALLRAALSIPSAAFGLLGFWLALLDPQGQTLHDKLTGARLVRQ
ncbi:MAG: RDD family protein [Deltaproteobacteria bacterium]|nr:RDD family protein [Deltaproteobacteria bacterium]